MIAGPESIRARREHEIAHQSFGAPRPVKEVCKPAPKGLERTGTRIKTGCAERADHAVISYAPPGKRLNWRQINRSIPKRECFSIMQMAKDAQP